MLSLCVVAAWIVKGERRLIMLAMNRAALSILCATAMSVPGIGACVSAPSDAAVATPSVTVSQPSVRAGRSVDVIYRFQVSPGATLSEEHLVFVHAYDRGGTRLWTADHRPSPPTTAWAGGSVVEYTQPMTVPLGAPAGPADILIGLYLPRTGDRLPLAASGGQSRAYPAASLDVTAPPLTPPPVFAEGWYPAESPEVGLVWRWSKGAARARPAAAWLWTSPRGAGVVAALMVSSRLGPI